MSGDLSQELFARQQAANQSSGKQGWADGMMNKGASSLSGQACGLDKPIFGGGGIFGLIANGGAYGMKPGQKGLLQKIAASAAEDCKRINAEGNQILQQAIAAAGQSLGGAGVQLAAVDTSGPLGGSESFVSRVSRGSSEMDLG